MLREPRTGRPARGAKLVALVLVVGLLGASAPVLIPASRWVLDLVSGER
jgi:hypothetical protein